MDSERKAEDLRKQVLLREKDVKRIQDLVSNSERLIEGLSASIAAEEKKTGIKDTNNPLYSLTAKDERHRRKNLEATTAFLREHDLVAAQELLRQAQEAEQIFLRQQAREKARPAHTSA